MREVYKKGVFGFQMAFFAYLLLIIKNIIYGSSVYFTEVLSESVDVLDILAIRFLISFLMLFSLKSLKIAKINVGIKDVFWKTEHSKHMKLLMLAAFFESVLYMFFETFGISMTTCVTAGVILSLMPISSCICESIILKEKTTFFQKVFLGLGIIGVIYISVNTNTTGGKDTALGIILIVLAVISASMYMVFSRKSSVHFNAMEVTYFSALFGMIAFNFVNIIRHIIKGYLFEYFSPLFNVQDVISFLFLGIVCTILAKGMNNFALSKIQTSTVSAFSGLYTIVTIVVGVVLNGEKLYYFHFIGMALILIRMIGVSYISIRKDKTHSDKKI